MQTAVLVAKNYFDKVVFVSRKFTNDNSSTIRFSNVEVLEVPDILRYRMFIESIVRGAKNSYIWSNLISTHNLSLFKSHITSQFMSDCLYFTALDRIERYLKAGDSIYTLATWFASEAITIARLHRRFPVKRTVSFAHSFEIDPDKNRYVAQSFNDFKHQNIDEVHYISHLMKDIYYNTARNLNIKEKYDHKAYFTYLGSIKYYEGISTASSDNVFRIVSCSGVTSVKRLHLIVEALNNWQCDTQIEWTHIGGGPLFDKLKSDIAILMHNNPRVSVNMLGWKTNKEVQKYYSENTVDLFINVSEAEGLPVSIMEAMSYGIPCLATDVGGTSEIVTDSTGILISKNSDGIEILNELNNFIRLDLSKRKQYRDAAYKIWTRLFDAKVTMAQFFAHIAKS